MKIATFSLSSVVVLLTCLLLAGCVDEAPYPEQPGYTWEDWLNRERLVDWDTMVVDGRTRTFIVHLPPHHESSDSLLPLVIGLHGTGGSALQFSQHYNFSKLADDAGFIAVYPNGVRSDGRIGIRTWNAGNCCDFAVRENIDDVRFIQELIAELTERYRVNPKRVYATGMSNGGMMAYRLAAEIPEQIAAIAPVSGTMVFDPPADQSRPVPVLHLHSVLDQIIPYHGGTNPLGYYFPPVDSVLNVWAGRNGCLPDARVTEENDNYMQMQWVDESGTPLIVHYTTQDGGHSWPGGQQVRPNAAPPSTAIDANKLIWDFFKQFNLP